MSALRAVPLAALLGVLSSTAFAPLSWPGTMVVAVAGLFWLASRLRDARTRVVVLVGAVHGLAFMGPLIWWMNAVSGGAYVALVIAETVFLTLVVVALRTVMRLRWWPLLAPGVWVAGEWARGSFPFNGFPWGRLGHTAIDTPWAPFARYVGLSGTSLLLAFVAVGLVLAATSSRRVRIRSLAAVATSVVVGIVLPTGIASAGDTRRVAIVQGDVPGVFLTWPRGEIFELHAAETQRLADRVASGSTEPPDVVLWPENATDIDPYADPAVRDEIESLSAQLDAPILVGGIFDGPTAETSYNAGVVWTENGPGDRYVKRRPVPYGEYVPFRQSLGALVPRFDRDIPRDMQPGDLPGGLSIDGAVFGDTICYDIAYDEIVRDVLADGAQVLVVQTSNAAFTDTAQPEQQWDISRMRAIETGRWVLVPSTNGISGVIDPTGRAVQRAPLGEPATIQETIELATESTPARYTAPVISTIAVVAGLGGWALGSAAGRGSRRSREDAADAHVGGRTDV